MFTELMLFCLRCGFSILEIAPVFPVDWDGHRRVMKKTKKRYKWFLWFLGFIANIVSIFYFGIHLLIQLVHPAADVSVVEVILWIAFFLISIGTICFSLSFYWWGDDLCMVASEALKWDATLKDIFPYSRKLYQGKFDLTGNVLMVFLAFAFPITIFSASFLVFGGDFVPLKRFLKDLSVEHLMDNTFFVTFFITIHCYYITFFGHNIGFYTGLAIFYIEGTKGWMFYFSKPVLEYAILLEKSKQKHKLSVLLHCIRKHIMILKIINIIVNNHAVLVGPSLLSLMFSLGIIFHFCAIKMRWVIPIYATFSLVFFALLFLFCESILLPSSSKIHTNSKDFVYNWSKNNCNLMRKWVNSVHPLRMNVGSLFYVEYGTYNRFMTFLVDNSLTMLLLVKVK